MHSKTFETVHDQKHDTSSGRSDAPLRTSRSAGSDMVPTLGGLENPPPPPRGRDRLPDPREEPPARGRCLGDRRMHERAYGGEGGGYAFGTGPNPEPMPWVDRA